MNQFQMELVRIGIDDAATAIDKATAALSAYMRKPDPPLIEMALDYMVASRAKLHNPKIFVRIACEDPRKKSSCRDEGKTPAGAANTDEGEVDTSDQTVSASTINENGGFVKCPQ